MNKFVRTGTSLLLSLLILVSGSGLIIGKMVCAKSGYVLVSANEAEDCCLNAVADCCAAEEEESSFNDQCCSLNNFAFQQQQFVSQNQLLIKSPEVSSLVVLPGFLAFTTAHFSAPQHCFSSSNPPDHLSGPAALPLLGVFRI